MDTKNTPPHAGTLLLFLGLSFSSMGLAVCKAEVRTVDWYMAHDSERIAQLKKCESNPGELREDPNCINASRAASKKTWSSRKGIQVKPINFGKR